MFSNTSFKKIMLMICPQPFLILRGTPNAILNKIKVFQNLQYHIFLLIPNCHPVENPDKYISSHNLTIIKTPTFMKLKTFNPGFSFYKIIILPFFIYQSIKLSLNNNFDFVFCLEDGIFYGLILKLLFNKKIIYRVHTLPSNYPTHNFILKYTFKFLDFLFCSFSDAIAVINHLDELKIKNRYNQNVFFINVIPALNDGKKQMNKELNLFNKNKFTILWYGNTEKYQNFDLFLKLIIEFQNDDNFYFVVCSNDEIKINNFKNFTILKIDEINNFDELFNNVDLCVSFKDDDNGFPSRLVVFIKYHKAILASDTKVHRTYLKHNVNAYLVPKEFDKIKDAIKHLHQCPEKIKMFEDKIKDLYVREFSFEKYQMKFEKLIKSIMN